MIYDSNIEAFYATFNGYDFNSSVSKVLDVDTYSSPAVTVNNYKLARSDGEVVVNSTYGGKNITIKGRIKASDRTELDNQIDIFKSYLSGHEKYLDLLINGITRRYIATVTNTSYTIRNGCVCLWEIEFTTSGFGYDTSTSSLTFGTYAASNTPYSNTIGGSYKTYPIIDLTVNQVDPYWSNKYLQVKNSVTNQRLRITRTWHWHDRIVINGNTRQVTLYPTIKTIIDEMNLTTGWTSGHTLSSDVVNMKEGSGAQKIVMGSAATSTYIQKLNFAPSINLDTSTGKIIIPVFIPTPTSGIVTKLTLTLGSDTTLASNYLTYEKTTQWNGATIATNDWNYFEIDMLTTPTSTVGTPVRAGIKSLKITLSDSSNFQLNGALIDYITLNKTSIIPQLIDYEGTFTDLEIGNTVLTFEDEFTTRNITITGNYTKRYL